MVVADRQRTLVHYALDLFTLACLLLWAYEVIAHAWAVPFHAGPAELHGILVGHPGIKLLGMMLAGGGLLLYAFSLRRLGSSWRMGIDRSTPGPLVTGGVYRWSRHPIYVAFDMVFVGTFLLSGRTVFLLLAVLAIALLHLHLLREEQFLREQFPGAYDNYCRRVGRYVTWSPRQHGPGPP